VKITKEGLRRVGLWALVAVLVLVVAAGFVTVLSWAPWHAGS
jgi:hypothetical protein